jgi:amino acid adenylation domain-containing protein
MNIQNYPGGWDHEPGRGAYHQVAPSRRDLYCADNQYQRATLDHHRHSTLTSLIEQQARLSPARPAIECDGILTSYHELNEEATRMAACFRTLFDVVQGDRVGIMLDRTQRAIVVMLAVLKAGAVCVPIEPSYPQARKDLIISDAALKLVVTQYKYQSTGLQCRRVIIEDLPILPLGLIESDAPRPTDLAYIMYTSGSTGKPKGVMIEHRSVVDLAIWQWEYFNIQKPRRISQMSSFSFDGAIGECVMALTSGSTLVIVPNEDFMNLVEVINTKKIDIVVTGPAILNQLDPSRLGHKATIISVGERCPERLYDKWREHCDFVNGYGPTEYSVYSHAWRGTEAIETPVPIGRSRTNLKTYIANQSLELCPLGMAGEILLSGPGLARGYLNRPEQNFKSFIPNHFHLESLYTNRGEVDNAVVLMQGDPQQAIPESVIAEISQQIAERSKNGSLVADIESQFSGPLKDDALRLLRNNESDNELKRTFLRYYFEGKFHTYKAFGISWEAFRILAGREVPHTWKGADLGCGNGELVQMLASNGIGQVTGLDINPYFVQNLIEKGLPAALARADSPTHTLVRESGLSPESLDFVISTLTLDRVQYPKQLIANMTALLREGGRFMLGTLLPVVEFEDGNNRSSFAYTRFENKLTPGSVAKEDVYYVVQELVAAGIADIELFSVKIMINSKNGLQPYDLQVFCGNRDSTRDRDDHTRLYRTGDYARYLQDGNIEFIGRMDDQVKVRGHRIELGEVENTLMGHPAIANAVVAIKPRPEGEGQLTAWLVRSGEVSVNDVRTWMSSIVPVQMVPQTFVFVEALPLNASGKVDKQALLSLEYKDGEGETVRIASPQEQETILKVWNSTSRAIPETTVHDLFERQAQATPDQVALHFDDVSSLTYAQLNEKANRLCHFLKGTIKPGDQLGILMEENIDAIVTVIAVLKSACAYVPLDPTYPPARLAAMLADGQIKTVVTVEEYQTLTRALGGAINFVFLDANRHLIEKESSVNPQHDSNGNGLAYVMYTSGTTGLPKKVGIDHRAVVRLVKNTNYWQFSKEQSRILKTGAFSFDASTFEMWSMLLNGGEIFLYPKRSLLDPQFLKEKISTHRIPLLWMTTSWFNQLVDIDPEIFRPLRTLLIGGEKASVPHVNKLTATCPHLELINAYGPTENTTFSTFYKVKGLQAGVIPVGIPVSNSTVYVLDPMGRLLPPGVDGEVYVGGLGVAKGYLNDEELTRQRFLPDPFQQGGRMYKTGDIGKWQADGTIMLRGRADGQLKIRGHRVETGEVEDALSSVPGITGAAILVKQHDGHKDMIAAFTAGREIAVNELRENMSERLPDYMIPAQFFQVREWPINSNGKLDRERLLNLMPAPETREAHTSMTPLMKDLLFLWEESLGQPQESVDDNFFHIGGDSLLALKLMARIKARFNLSIPVSVLFEAPTIRMLAAIISKELRVERKSHVIYRAGIVQIQAEGSKPPLFVVPGYLFYHHLSRHLGEDQPIYGFEPVPNLSTEEAATFYIGQMRAVQPQGPYYIGGYCAGGIIAYEIARQLKASGQQVGLLALFETYTSEGVVPKTSLQYLQDKVKHLRKKFMSSSLGEVVDVVRKELLRTLGFAGNYIRGLVGGKYVIQPYDGKISLFVASDGMVGSAKDPFLGWGRYCGTQHLEVNHVPGNHDTMFKEPHVGVLAGRLREMLDKARVPITTGLASAWLGVMNLDVAVFDVLSRTCL